MELKKIYSISNPIAENSNSTKLPSVIRLYPSANSVTGDLLKISEGAVSFFVNFFNEASVPGSNVENEPESITFRYVKTVLEERKRRLSKEFILENFWVYNITDYGHQSLSPGFDDFIAIIYDINGYKIPQRFTAYIRNYTTKELFILIRKDINTLSPVGTISILPNDKIGHDDELIELNYEEGNGVYSVNMSTANINSIDDITIYFFGKDNYPHKLQKSDYFLTLQTLEMENNTPSTYVSKQENYFNNLFAGNTHNKGYLNISVKINTILDDTLIGPITPGFKKVFIKIDGRGVKFYRNTYAELKGYSFPITEKVDIYTTHSLYKMERMIPGIDYYTSNGILTIVGAANTTIFEVYVRNNNDRALSIPFTGVSEFDLVKWLYNLNITDWNIDIVNSKVELYENGILVNIDSEINSSKRYEYFIYDIVLDEEIEQPEDILEDTINATIINSTNTFDSFDSVPTGTLNYTIFTDPYLNTYGETSVYAISELPEEIFLLDRSLNFKIGDFNPGDGANITKWIREPSILAETRTFNGSPRVRHTLIDRDTSLMDTVINNFVSEYNYYIFKDGVAPSTDDELAGRSLYRTLNQSKLATIESNIATFKNNWKDSITNYGDITSSMTNTTGLIENIGNFWMLVIKPSKTNSPFNIEYYGPNGQLKKKEYSCVATNGYYYSMPFFLDAFGDPGEYNENIENETAVNRITNVSISYINDSINDSGSFNFLAIK
jgi:hypothetical protein